MPRSILLVVALAVTLLAAADPAAAALRAPSLQAPAAEASGPTFPVLTWKAVKGTHLYEVAISADQGFGSIVTGSTIKTRNTAATLNKSLADGTYSWRVRSVSKSGKAGRWSKRREFTKVWQQAPDLVAPANELSVQWPGSPLVLRWTAVPRATKYLVTVATDPSLAQPIFRAIETHATVYAVPGALASGRYYWAVQPVDEAGFKGRRSRVGAFSWTWASATQVSIEDVDPRPDVVEPFVRWATVPGATKYQVEINPTAEFAVGSKVFDEYTIATSVSPRDPLPNNTYYVRVRAIDGKGNAGGWVTSVAEKRFTPVVHNLRIGDNVTASIPADTPNSKPLIAWDPIAGAAGYTLQISPWTGTNCNWSSMTVATTPNSAWTPTHRFDGIVPDPAWSSKMTTAKNTLANGQQYCVRARAFQSDGTYGAWTERKPAFTFQTPTHDPPPPCASLGMPESAYRGPVGGVHPRTPVFTWTEVAGAQGYWVVISRDAEFTTIAEVAWVEVPAYASPTRTYTDETTSYYWAVIPAPRLNGSCVSSNPGDHNPRSFHKRSSPPGLISPGAGQDVWTQPTFRWTPAEGASTYRVEVDTDPSFVSPIESATTASTTLTTTRSYPVDNVLYWRVRAIDMRGVQLNWSAVGTFRRRLPAPDSRPNPAGGEVIPALDWSPVDGAIAYDFHVDQADGTSKDFTISSSTFTPSVWYGTGIWRWKVRARFPSLGGDTVTGPYGGEQSYVRRLSPPQRPRIVYRKDRLYFAWDSDAAAAQYRLEVSKTNSFTQTVDSVRTPQTEWAPLLSTQDYLDGGKLYWRLANVDQGGNVGAYALGNFRLPKALRLRTKVGTLRRGSRSRLVVTVTDPNKMRVRKASVTLSGAGLKRVKKRSGKKGTVTFKVRARKRGTIVLKASRSGYRTGELRLSVR